MKLPRAMIAKILATTPTKKRNTKTVPFLPAWSITLAIPTTVRSEANSREHWAAKNRRKHAQADALSTMLAWTGASSFVRDRAPRARGLLVTWTRIGRQVMDDDNLANAFKGLRDALSAILKVDDGDTTRISFAYEQRQGTPGVEVRIENRTAPHSLTPK